MGSKRLIEGQDYCLRYMPFPNNAADGAVVSHPDIPCVYINTNVCESRQKEALEHELRHIECGDLYSEEDAVIIEERMNGRR